MAIHELKKQTDIEKRLKLLRQQIYGKEKKWEVRGEKITTTHLPHLTSSAEISYLYKDLLKILIFASLAIGAQVILFFLSKNHILNLNFF
ncbi:MAG: hypothetical protein AAB414_01380 [Patescibacteria group bacterium]